MKDGGKLKEALVQEAQSQDSVLLEIKHLKARFRRVAESHIEERSQVDEQMDSVKNRVKELLDVFRAELNAELDHALRQSNSLSIEDLFKYASVAKGLRREEDRISLLNVVVHSDRASSDDRSNALNALIKILKNHDDPNFAIQHLKGLLQFQKFTSFPLRLIFTDLRREHNIGRRR
jgi:hypothetical protein